MRSFPALLIGPLVAILAHENWANFQDYSRAISPSCADLTPSIASAVGYTACSFADLMTSSTTTDLYQTNLPGFNWYTQNNYCEIHFHAHTLSATILSVDSVDGMGNCGQNSILQNMTIGAGASQQTAGDLLTPGTIFGTQISGSTGEAGNYNISSNTATVGSSIAMTASIQQPASTYSFSNTRGQEISNVSQGLNNFSESTVALLTGGTSITNNTYHGTTFINGLYWRIYFTFDESLSNNGCASGLRDCRWPAIWMQSYAGTTTSNPTLEVDALDMTQGPTGSVSLLQHLHTYTATGDIDSELNYSPRSQLCTPSLDGTTFHTIDTLWIPTSSSFLGGMGLWKFFFDAQTCAGAYAVGSATINGTSLSVVKLAAGSLTANQWIDCNGCGGGVQISSGSDSSWTLSSNVGYLGTVNFIAGNMEGCPYFGEAETPCPISGSNTRGAFSAPERYGAGINLLLSAGCTATTVSYPATNSQCSGSAGSWPIYFLNSQVWQASLSDKVVQ
jgi:hypothetical protein